MNLNQQHFELFKLECQKQLERLGLKSWKVYYEFVFLKDCFGRATWDYSGAVATICCSTYYQEPFDNLEQQIKETALHECLEIFLGRISFMAQRRDYIQQDFEKEIHSVIRTLEKLL